MNASEHSEALTGGWFLRLRDDYILMDPKGEDVFAKENLAERSQHACDVCESELARHRISIEDHAGGMTHHRVTLCVSLPAS